jgi:hypothetical protein
MSFGIADLHMEQPISGNAEQPEVEEARMGWVRASPLCEELDWGKGP